jgi:alkylation response protein AidB-like acyl-CoA dehydrogenase
MRAVFTEEQEMLRSTASRIAESVMVTQPDDLDRIDRKSAWRALGSAGLLGMRVRDDDGAPLTSGVEVMLVAQGLAGAIAPTPFVGVVLAADLLARAGAPEAWLGDIAEGRVRYSVLLTPGLDRIAGADALEGAICIDAEGATFGLALTSDRRVARVDLAGMAALEGVDLSRPLGVLASGAAAPELVGKALSENDLKSWTALALTLACADIVGVLRVGLQRVVEYSKTRIQYGVPIGSFQAVQHMCAEMLVETEAAASATNYAAWAVDALDGDAGLLAARTAKAYCAPVAQQVGVTLMQAYGGIGQVWEHEAHLRTRRAMFDGKIFGDAAHQLVAIADTRLGHA